MTQGAVSAVDRKAGYEGRGLPVTMRNLAHEPFAARSPSTQPSHVGAGTGFVDENQVLGVKLGLFLSPLRPRRSDVRPILLGRAHAFF